MDSQEQRYEQLVQQAIDAMRADQDEDVLRLLQEAIAVHPQSPIAPFLLGSQFAQRREYDRAEGLFIHTLNLAPDFAVARFQLGLLQLTSARPSAAFATWGPLDLLDAGHYLRVFKDGLEAMAQDRFEQAKALLRKGIDTNQENLPLNCDMQMVIAAMEDKEEEMREAAEGATRPAAADAADAAEPPPEQKPEVDRSGTMEYLLSRYRKQ